MAASEDQGRSCCGNVSIIRAMVRYKLIVFRNVELDAVGEFASPWSSKETPTVVEGDLSRTWSYNLAPSHAWLVWISTEFQKRKSSW